MYENIARLVELIQKMEGEAAGEEAALDAIWLMTQVIGRPPDRDEANPDRANPAADRPPALDNLPAGPLPGNLPTTPPAPPPAQPGQAGPESQLKLPDVAGKGGKAQAATPFRVPAVAALPASLELARSLRPLRRKIPSRRKAVLDEQATARRIAEEGIWLPVQKPALDRWLEVALVVDQSSTMLLWQPLVRELYRLLSHLGAFRDVRVWGLGTDGPPRQPVYLQAGLNFNRPTRSRRGLRELVEPGGRRLVLLVSDCVAEVWRDGTLAKGLAELGRTNPLALIQTLPEYMWSRSALGDGTPVAFNGPLPGMPNSLLQVRSSSYFLEDELVETGLRLPVMRLEPAAVARWARMFTGAENALASGYLLPVVPDSAERADGAGQSETTGEVTKEEIAARLASFRQNAKEPARRLALLLSGLPINFPIIRLVQRTMLPEANQGHIAELFLSGLLRQLTPPDQVSGPDGVQYAFREGVGEIFFESLRTSELVELVRQISRFVEENYGQTLPDFTALLTTPGAAGSFTVSQELRPFARFQARVLRRLGSQFVPIADQLELENTPSDNDSGQVEGFAIPPQETSQTESQAKPTPTPPKPLTREEALNRLEFVMGDLLELKVDAIVRPTNRALEWGGEISRQILARLGTVEIDAAQREDVFKNTGVAVTQQPGLGAPYIFHAATSSANLNETINDNTAIITTILEKAEALELKSLGFPSIGTGLHGLSALQTATPILNTIVTYLEKGSNLEKITFVFVNEEIHRAYITAYEQLKEPAQAVVNPDPATSPSRHSLFVPPSPSEHFAGRVKELAELKEVLQEDVKNEVVLTALSGPPGAGKTTLARQVAYNLYKDGLFAVVLWVNDWAWYDPWMVLRGWAAQCGVVVNQVQPDWDTIADQVRFAFGRIIKGRTLVVFDDVWIDKVVVVGELLKALPLSATVLLTSRDVQVGVALKARLVELGTLSTQDAIAFLRQYLEDAKNELPQEKLEELVEILKGPIILTLVLAAERLKAEEQGVAAALPRHVSQYKKGLPVGSALARLPVGDDFTERENSLKLALAYSYDTLTPDQQARFRALGVLTYDQPFDLQQLAWIWNVSNLDEENEKAKEISREWAEELRDLSLIETVTEASLGEGWYRQHPILHSYAAALLRTNPKEESTAQDRYYDRMTEITNAFYELRNKPEEWDFLDPYLPHIEVTGDALVALLQAQPDSEVIARRALHFALNIYYYLARRQEVHKLKWLEMGLSAARTLRDRSSESIFLGELASYHSKRDNLSEALEYYEQALAINRKQNDQRNEAASLTNIGAVYNNLGDRQQALNYFEQALLLLRATDDQAGEATTLNNIGAIYSDLGDKQQALAYYERTLPVRKATGDRAGEATTLNNIGSVYNAMGDKQQALAYYEQALPLRRATGDRYGEAFTLNNIGAVYSDLGDKAKALAYYEQALPLQRAIGNRNSEAITLNNIGIVLWEMGQQEDGLQLVEQAQKLFEQVGSSNAQIVAAVAAQMRIVTQTRKPDTNSGAYSQIRGIVNQRLSSSESEVINITYDANRNNLKDAETKIPKQTKKEPSKLVINEAALRNLSFREITKLVELLMDCPSFGTTQGRNSLVKLLPTAIQEGIPYSVMGTAKMEILNIVQTSLKFSGGFEALLEVLKFYDDGTISMRNLEEFVIRVSTNTPESA